MAAIMTPPVVSDRNAPKQNLLLDLPSNTREPQEKQPARSILAAILRGTILTTFAAGALVLLSFGLMPAVFVTLVLIAFALSPVIVLGLAIVFTEDLQRDESADTRGQPCSCHQDRLENRFAQR